MSFRVPCNPNPSVIPCSPGYTQRKWEALGRKGGFECISQLLRYYLVCPTGQRKAGETQVWSPTAGSRGPGRGAGAKRQLVSLTGSMQAELSQPCHRHTPHSQERTGCSAQAGSQLRDSCPILILHILQGTSSPAAPQMVICLLWGKFKLPECCVPDCASGDNSVRDSSLQPLTGLSK